MHTNFNIARHANDEEEFAAAVPTFCKILEINVTNIVMLVAKKNLRVVGKAVRCCQRLPFPSSRSEAHPT